MDRICNNEGLVILSTLYLTQDMQELSRLDLFLILCVDRVIRKRIVNYNNYEQFISSESVYSIVLNRKFKEFQPIILNAWTLMSISGIIEECQNTELQLTEKGIRMGMDAFDLESKSACEDKEASMNLITITKDINTEKLYNDLNIIL